MTYAMHSKVVKKERRENDKTNGVNINNRWIWVKGTICSLTTSLWVLNY